MDVVSDNIHDIWCLWIHTTQTKAQGKKERSEMLTTESDTGIETQSVSPTPKSQERLVVSGGWRCMITGA